MGMTNTTAIESLRTFAMAHGEAAFAHLCTEALAELHHGVGDAAWARERVEAVLANVAEGYATSAINTVHALQLIKFADTTRPDGAVARNIQL